MFLPDFKKQMGNYSNVINEELMKYIPSASNGQREVAKAMKYSLSNGGKRLRPMLVLEFCKMCGGDVKKALPYACAIEFIHTYSLIHDDLPCMDNDDMRRGKPSCHKMYGEAIALLAGDALLTHAFEVCSSADLPAENNLNAVSLLAQNAGVGGMIGGQVVDLDSEGKPITEETVRYMYRLKTGCLLKAPALIAIAAAGAESTEAAAHLLGYTETVGLAFQIKDDILDVEGDAAILGKKTGQDAKEEKSSMTAVMGVPYCKTLLQDLTKQAMARADFFGDRGAFLRDMASYLLVREN